MLVGAGTLLTEGNVRSALDAGARFGLATGWNVGVTQPPQRVSGDAQIGTFAMRLFITNATSTPNTSEVNQNLADAGGGAIVPGTVYTLSFWAKSAASGPSYVQNYGVNWLNSGGGSVGFSGWIGFNPGGAWSQFAATNLVAPAGAVNAIVALYGATGAVPGGNGGTLIDAVALAPVTMGATNVSAPTVTPGVQLSWLAESGRSYQIQKTTNLSASTGWTNSAALLGSGQEAQWFDGSEWLGPAFYRLRENN